MSWRTYFDSYYIILIISWGEHHVLYICRNLIYHLINTYTYWNYAFLLVMLNA